MKDYLLLKWGTIKGWDFQSDGAKAAAQKLNSIISGGAMQQKRGPEHNAAICDLIDAIDGEIQNDWSGEIMTKEEAKSYITGYSK